MPQLDPADDGQHVDPQAKLGGLVGREVEDAGGQPLRGVRRERRAARVDAAHRQRFALRFRRLRVITERIIASADADMRIGVLGGAACFGKLGRVGLVLGLQPGENVLEAEVEYFLVPRLGALWESKWSESVVYADENDRCSLWNSPLSAVLRRMSI